MSYDEHDKDSGGASRYDRCTKRLLLTLDRVNLNFLCTHKMMDITAVPTMIANSASALVKRVTAPSTTPLLPFVPKWGESTYNA